MTFRLHWIHPNGLFGFEDHNSQVDFIFAARQMEKDGCSVELEEIE